MSLAAVLIVAINKKKETIAVLEGAQEELIFPAQISAPRDRMGCQAMVQNFCSQLYAPDAQGNLSIKDSDMEYATLQGYTRNDFDQAWYAFYKVRLKNASRLPGDLRSALSRRGFFEKLGALLKRPPLSKLQLDSSFVYDDLEAQVDSIWDRAIDETVVRRVEKTYPGSFRFKPSEIPQHIEVENTRVRSKLWSKISLALWRGHPNWKYVEDDFAELKKAFVAVIDRFAVKPEIKQLWKEKVASVELALPGEDPVTSNQDCISVSRNAYYYRYLNKLTVCAGYFTGGAQILTLAHELSHSLDFATRTIDFQRKTNMTLAFQDLKKQVCVPKEFKCDQWQKFKDNFDSGMEEISKVKAEAPEVHACLHKTPPTKDLTKSVVREKAGYLARKRFSEFATNSAFFRLTNEEVKGPAGKRIANPSYLNPCATDAWDTSVFAIDSEFTSLLLFTAAYRCVNTDNSTERLRMAIIEAKEMTEKVLTTVIGKEGVFSARDELQSEGYSSPSMERFADRIGSYAVAEYLNKFSSIEKKRAAYLASNFWLCEKPSLKTENYEHFQALHEFILDRGVHGESTDRIVDWLSPPVMAALDCAPDFEQRSCVPLGEE